MAACRAVAGGPSGSQRGLHFLGRTSKLLADVRLFSGTLKWTRRFLLSLFGYSLTLNPNIGMYTRRWDNKCEPGVFFGDGCWLMSTVLCLLRGLLNSLCIISGSQSHPHRWAFLYVLACAEELMLSLNFGISMYFFHRSNGRKRNMQGLFPLCRN